MRSFPYEHASRRRAEFHPPIDGEMVRVDCLEIGPGRGDFLFAEAAEHPERRYAAIEIKNRRYARLIKSLERLKLPNVLLIHGDARIVVGAHIPEDSLTAVYILFPDPWPKRRHASMRLLSGAFLDTLSRRMREGGDLIIATDDQDFAAWMRRNLQEVRSFVIESEHISAEAGPVHTPTHYELKWKARGRQIATLRCRKSATAEETQEGRTVHGRA